MVRRVKTVSPDTTLSEAAHIMVRERINRIPVVDENHRVVGIVGRADILESMVAQASKPVVKKNEL